jgi:hypothetical protein
VTSRGTRKSSGTARASAANRSCVEQAQAVEKISADWQLAAQRLHVASAAEPTHGDLKGMRATGGGEGNRLTVKDCLARRQRAHCFDDFRHGTRHIVQRARVDAHFVARLVNLDAPAIHFPFKRNGTIELLESLSHARSGLREHWGDGGEQRELEARERIHSLEHRDPGDLTEIRRKHRRAAHACNGQIRRGGDGIHHHARERTLPQLADQQAHEELLLRRDCEPKELAQRRCAKG